MIVAAAHNRMARPRGKAGRRAAFSLSPVRPYRIQRKRFTKAAKSAEMDSSQPIARQLLTRIVQASKSSRLYFELAVSYKLTGSYEKS
jgi:hypothetical protein